MKSLLLSLLAIFFLHPTLAAQEVAIQKQTKVSKKKGASKLMYTTYFYTAAEAVVHGYAKNTEVRIVNLDAGKTVWKGVVNRGETKNVRTGKGVFGFYSNKKASILVGTPSVCNVVGYWFRDEEGSSLSTHYYGKVPSRASNPDERILIWSWEDTHVDVVDVDTQKKVYSGKISKGSYYEIKGPALKAIVGHTLEVKSKKKVSVQVYFDEGFFIPSNDGRTTGKRFQSYVGKITEGKNDLNLISYFGEAAVKVVDANSNISIWEGKIKGGEVKTLTLAGRFVRVISDTEISALVAPYEHYKKGGYAEHHYGAGVEGTGIDNEFYITTPQELWVFSYFNNNTIEVIDMKTKLSVWKGEISAGKYKQMPTKHGYYRVRSNAGISVMGGAAACGAEFSPAGGLFKIDEKIFEMMQEIYQAREKEAEKKGKKLSDKQRYKPLSPSESSKVRDYLNESTGQSLSEDEVQQRVDSIQEN